MKKYTQKFQVLSDEVNQDGFIQIESLQRRIQKVSDDHGNMLGFGFDDMNTKSVFWVVSRLAVKINIRPKLGDCLSIVTFLTKPSGAGVNRYYQILNQDGACCVEGVAKWSIVSRNTFHVLRIGEFDFIANLTYPDQPLLGFKESLKRIHMPDDGEVLIKKRVVQESDLDFNQHVNNTKYVYYLYDMFDLPQKLKNYQINYIQPLYLGDEFEVRCVKKGCFYFFEATTIDMSEKKQISFHSFFEFEIE